MYKIRPLQKDDRREVAALFNQLVMDPAKFDFFSDLDLSPLVDDPNCHCLVAEDGGKVIGFGSLSVYLTPVYGYKGKIEDMVVDKNYRGQGLGRKLLESLINIAKEKNIKSLYLTSNPARQTAIRLYESAGFEKKDTGIYYLNFA